MRACNQWITALTATALVILFQGMVGAGQLRYHFVPANSQVVVSASDFGEFRGWVLADSGDVAGVTGNLRVGSPDRTSLDIAEPAQLATTIILPFMAQGAGASTEISLVNPNASSARIDVKLYDRESPDGKPVGSVFKVLPPYGMVSGTLNTLFTEVTSFDNASHLVAKSTPLNIFSSVVNIIGYDRLQSGATRDAVEILKLNASAYPDSANVYDSLSDAYLADGQKDLARQNAQEALRRLESDTTDPEVRRNAIRTSAEQKLKQLGETNK